MAHARGAAAEAKKSLGDHLFAPTWHGLSDNDKRFLAALVDLSQEQSTPRVAAVCKQAEIGESSVSAYRRRLLLSGLAGPAGRGQIRLSHPAIASWLKQAVALGSVNVPAAPQPGP